MKKFKIFKKHISINGLKYFYIIFIIVFFITTVLLFIFLKNNIYLSVYSDEEIELLKNGIAEKDGFNGLEKLDLDIAAIEKNFQDKIKIKSDNIKDIFNN
ncbi:MAG TPA: hypothetical protein PKL13_03635 [bacterium]|nr:hypothetical protein [bacterium]